MEYKLMRQEYDGDLAKIVRRILEAHKLDIPGTAYYDEGLDHLSAYYADCDGCYYALIEEGEVVGGIGYEAFEGFPDCCELQKLYLAENMQGSGIGYEMISFIEDRARENGYKSIYLETHSNLQAAIHIYRKMGYREIERPECVVHGTMDLFFLKDLEVQDLERKDSEEKGLKEIEQEEKSLKEKTPYEAQESCSNECLHGESKVKLREYTEADLEAMIAIWNEVVEEGIAFPQEENLDEISGEEFFASQSYCGVAEVGDAVLGLYILHPNNVGRCGHICNASYAVRSDCRGRHVGEKLVKDCLKKAGELGFRVLQFNAVVESNIHARHLYERLGFVQLGTIPEGFRMKDGHYENICPYYHML